MDTDIIFSALNILATRTSEHFRSLESNALPVTANLTTTPPLASLPLTGLGTEATFAHLQSDIVPHLAQGHTGPRYYGINCIVLVLTQGL
jgi:hypothetical protein